MRCAAAGRWAATVALALALGMGERRGWPADQPSDGTPTDGTPAATAAAPAFPSGRVVRYSNDQLTVRLAKVPVVDVLTELERQSGAEVVGQVREPRDVSAEFDDVPLPEALHRLLGSQNFALVYGEGDRLRAVKLLGGPLTGPVPTVPGAAAAPVPQPPPAAIPTSPAALLAMFERHGPVPVTGRLQELFGADSATLMQLVDAALHNDDALVRLEAIRTAVQTIEQDGELRSGLIGVANSLDIGELSTLVKSAAGEHADELTMHVATQAHATDIRAKASALLQQLRRPH